MTKYEKAHTKYRQSTKEKIRRERELLGAKGRLLLKQEGRGDLLEQVTSEETPKQGREGVARLPGEKKRNAEPPSSLTCSSRFKP